MKIEILTSPGCAKCRLAKKRVKEVAEKIADIEVSVVDITENPEVVQKYMLFATPGIVINGELAFTGIPREEELRRKIMKMSKGQP
jgi:small redox-active disulfide protein 1